MVQQASLKTALHGIIPTGSLALDAALGIGGIPCGCIASIYGKEGSSKTALVQTIIGQFQRAYPDRPVMYIIGEGKFSDAMARRNGVIFGDNLYFFRPSLLNGITYEVLAVAVEQLIQASVNTKLPPLIVIDSMDSMPSAKDMGGNAGDGNVGGTAKFNSAWLKRMGNICAESGATLLFTQQLRDVVNTGPMLGFGGPKTKTSGGWSPKFYSAVRIELIPIGSVKKGDDVVSKDIKAIVRKNEYHRPEIAIEYRLRFEYDEVDPGGIDRAYEAMQLGKALDLIHYSQPSWTFYGVFPSDGGDDERHVKCGSEEKARTWLLQHPIYLDALIGLIRAKMSGQELPPMVAEERDGEPEAPDYNEEEITHD